MTRIVTNQALGKKLAVAQIHLRIAFWASTVITLVTLAALGWIDTYLKNNEAPLGIVSFELCAYREHCAAIAESWKGIAQPMAAMSLGLDYLFMLAYPAAICLGLILAGPCLPGSLPRLSVALAYGIWGAGVADAVENYHLFQMLIGQPAADHQWAASGAATLKFIVLVPALLVWLAATLWYRAARTADSEVDA